MDDRTNGGTGLRVGDQVRRVKYNNGSGATVGQVATVKFIKGDFMVYVEYDGCLQDHAGAEGWYIAFTALSQEPQ